MLCAAATAAAIVRSRASSSKWNGAIPMTRSVSEQQGLMGSPVCIVAQLGHELGRKGATRTSLLGGAIAPSRDPVQPEDY
ncbi:hypothetical protein GCM10010442_82090 [Kitasatospora kifunensis]|uniref:Uncharacterized protein n=1 Tax=Kitasatospora kifunensis TaxID=58351 RepID=A0A7W7RBN5_KITKI|nr:hypothetical protein [Kitasatospora kifunensis]